MIWWPFKTWASVKVRDNDPNLMDPFAAVG
jgi:hypothetical protein